MIKNWKNMMICAILELVLFGAGAAYGQEGFSLIGHMDSTDNEADEGYFAIEQRVMIAAMPRSELHTCLRGKVNRQVKLTVQEDVSFPEGSCSFYGRLTVRQKDGSEFAIDETMIAVRPGYELLSYLRSHLGRQVGITVELDKNDP